MTDPDCDPGTLLTRRRLVQAGAGAAATLYLGGLTATAAAAATAAAPAYLRRSSYAKLTNAAFAVADGRAVTLRLTGVADLVRARHERALAGRDDAFALTFSGPAGVPLTSGVHALRHPSLGTFSIFISPVGKPATDQSYEVVVDRTTSAASAKAVAPQRR